jgi:hypothetical protein
MGTEAIDTFRRYLANLDWTKADFDERKAYACCIFSQFAYRHIPKMELSGTDRLKLIPCGAYEEQLDDGIDYDGYRVLAELALGEGFVIETERVIALGLITADKIFIAIRGTAKLYTSAGLKDALYDVKYFKAPEHPAITGAVHRGFLQATEEFCGKLRDQLIRWRWDRRPITITGHSLGGAISAILHTFWDGLQPELVEHDMRPTCTYTFGMPRFGNTEAVRCAKNLYPVYHPGDLIPTLPPRETGFADVNSEYALMDDGLDPTLEYKGKFRTLEKHAIANYRSQFETDSAIKRRLKLDQA